MKPRYTHDCNACVFLGTITYPGPLLDGTAPLRNADLYYCAGTIGGGSVIARHSSEGSDYSSMPASIIKQALATEQFSTSMPALIAAYYFAKAKGLFK